MTTLTAPEEHDVATSPPERSQLRLRRAGRLERTVDLSDGKWTIGSSPRCQVRLPAGESQPLQCLLSQTDDSAEVTRWAAGVLLNGREFARQTLAAGDRLTIGGWELEWQPATRDRRPRPERKSRPVAPEPPQAPERETVDYVPPASPERRDVAPLSTGLAPATPQTSSIAPTPTPASAIATETPSGPPAETFATSEPPIADERNVEQVVAPASPAPRPAAKTVLVASRLTDPFDGLLGPAPKTVATPAIVARALDVSAATFQDRLVLSLWQGGYAARERARQLIAAMRAARTRVAELETAIAEIERQLSCESAQSAADAAETAAQVSRLEGELAAAQTDRQQVAAELEALRNARPRTAPPDPRLQTLADELTRAQHEIAELRTQLAAQEGELESIRTQAEAAEADRRAEAEQFAAAQQSSRTHDEQFAAERAAWEQQRAAADADADRLREQLYACEMQIESLRGQVAEADAAQAALAQQLTTAQEQQSQWLTECQVLQENHAATLAGVTAERDGLQQKLEQFAAALSAEKAALVTASAAPALEDDWNLPAAEDAEGVGPAKDAAAPEANWSSWAAAEPRDAIATPESSRATIVDSVPRIPVALPEQADDSEADVEQALEPTMELARSTPEPKAPPEPSAGTEPPDTPYVPTSFIDKYRHLLEEGGDAEPSPRLSRPTLDDEYQSTRPSAAESPVEEETDEALEAYMSNLMRRVRGEGSSAAAAAATAAARFLDAPPEAAAQDSLAPVAPEPAAEPEIEVDANGMLRLARRQPSMSTDLSAMRELANNSARTAIARHRQRRHTELALSKGVICLLASGASAFLILTAPSMRSPWFWGGCATLAAAATTGVQLAVLGWLRWRDGRARRRAARFFQDERGSATASAVLGDVDAAS